MNKLDDKAGLSRRNFSKMAAIAPVLATLASRPVMGANCLSNVLSGNLSDPDRGECEPGQGPAVWAERSLSPDPKLKDTILFICPQFFEVNSNWRLSHILKDGTVLQMAIVAALLNASNMSNYILNVTQVGELCEFGAAIPGNQTLIEFLYSTWF